MEEQLVGQRFVITDAAKRIIEDIRLAWNAQFADRAGAVMLGWGTVHHNSGDSWQEVIVSFYTEQQTEKYRPHLRSISGLEVLFFVQHSDAHRFNDAALDHTPEQGFFLRPA